MDTSLTLVAASLLVLALTRIEALVGHARGRRIYRFADTVNDLLHASGHLAISAALRLGQTLGYAWTVEHLGVLTLDARDPLVWIAAFLLVDFLFYVRHVALHRVALLWCVHRVHHEPNQMNLAVAQRIGWLQDPTAWPFFLPAALLGVPVEVIVVVDLLNHLYQFFLHTELVPRLPRLEPFLMTPSGHRVHHACNHRYLDRNYGGMFPWWDRLFGTFEPESEAPVYGTVEPVRSWDPLENTFGPFRALYVKARGARSPVEALRVAFGPPAWIPGVGEVHGDPAPRVSPPSHGVVSPRGRWIAGAGLGLALAATLALVAWAPDAALGERLAALGAVLVGLTGLGRFLERG